MLDLLKSAWAGLDAVGRTVLVLCVTILIIVLTLTGADLSGLWTWLGVL